MLTMTTEARRRLNSAFGASRGRRLLFLWGVSVLCVMQPAYAQSRPLSSEERQALVGELSSLQKALQELPADTGADAAIFAKGLQWALDYDQEFTPDDIALLQNVGGRCRERIAALNRRENLASDRRGRIALGYVSRLDGSVQPYGVVVPRGYDPARPMRLDVVLHGSQKPIGMVELRFISRFDQGDRDDAEPPENSFIEIHPLGRVENCYRWAGEADVFEAIEDVCRRFNIDRERIVLRGMSMGASGTWHLGLKHPDRFVALGPYCGYVDTHRFSETPLPTFVKVGPLPEHQELGLHMLDSVDYAANAGIVPAIACMGEKDVFFDAHVIMRDAMRQEGLEMVNLISPGTGHVIDPVTHAEQMRCIAEFADRGINHSPAALRFVTWTLRYNRCHWLELEELQQHYRRSEVSAKIEGDVLRIARPTNVTRFVIDLERLPARPTSIEIADQTIPLPPSMLETRLRLESVDGQWRMLREADETQGRSKRPQLQGPIDDAFTGPFVCVRGTGTPWNRDVAEYAEASLRRFADEWRQYFRGDLPIKNDVDVTDADLNEKHLVLFGDPGSNPWIAKVQSSSPITWTSDAVTCGPAVYPAANHVPAWIMPNPLAAGQSKYVVINSGHTFRGAELGKLNYLLFPRWGDWAILKLDPHREPELPLSEEVLQAGYFDEQWRLP